MKSSVYSVLTLILFALNGFSQSTQKFIDSGSINTQFDYLIEKSNRYQEYKVVRQAWLAEIKSNVNDSLNASKATITANDLLIDFQKARIDSLNQALADSKSSINKLDLENQRFSILGIQVKKSVFRIIFFSIIGVLLLLLIIFISKFQASNRITKQTKLNLKELDEEFENHRKVALEREQKVRRQLQDEINKQKSD